MGDFYAVVFFLNLLIKAVKNPRAIKAPGGIIKTSRVLASEGVKEMSKREPGCGCCS